MKGAFACSPNLCPACSRAAIAIQTTAEPTAWAQAIEGITDERVRECVREYLRGVYQRAKVAAEARRASAEKN